MRERLKADPSATFSKYISLKQLEKDNERSFKNMSLLNAAHVLMLEKQQIINTESAKLILKAIVDLNEKGPTALDLNPNYEDYYYNVEYYLSQKLGAEIGGKLHTARSRNDLHGTILRMNVRDELLKFFPNLNNLRSTLLTKAQEFKETVFTGYTHMQPAQPITLGFYFASIAQALERDFDRLGSAYKRTNYSPLGACAFAGTSFQIDRQFTSELLGFDGPIVNALDAIASRDFILEILSSFVILSSTLNRFVHDLYYWCTDEFGYIELDDSLCVTSSIMPQKKNPAVLEYIKAKSSHELSAFVDAVSCMKGVAFGHNRDIGGESVHHFWDALFEMEAMLVLLNEVLLSIKVKTDALKERADSNYCTVTELADELVRSEGISFRVAHEIVGHVVMDNIDAGLSCKYLSSEKLDAASLIFCNRKFGWSEKRIRKILDSVASVENRISEGSPSPFECNKMITYMEKNLLNDVCIVKSFNNNLESALLKLDERVKKNLPK